ncbi:hypothetical protein SG34_021085 [Thalassomonas viridans]|uniref:DUF2846 domain-containing protein n=1 Tax=Thalassomonas viridans TaxID=137584 RepID=A0AAE9Z090_9GAMM|nr:hypothetical protein [Thalassomonas viridans]WDE03847.1 hypothetical protein SG34_021085 [Thalassomonas viridans]
MRLLLLLIATVLLCSCATRVTSLKNNENFVLEQGKGYVLFGIQTNQNLKTIYITGPQDIQLTSKDIKEGTNYLLIDLEAGIYTLDRLMLDNLWQLVLNDEQNWQFEVSEGQISYVGHLEVIRRGNWYPKVNIELVNRSSEALEFLEKDYSNILMRNSVVYGGPGQDRFFEFLADLSGE